ncbi:MAG: hypothetical protein FVQ85_12415 [Planctomycetes bacterium]|nr:hypothetical protein [Planctomycetota bacterium]
MNSKTNFKVRQAIFALMLAATGAVWNVTTVYGQAQPDYPYDGAVISGDIYPSSPSLTHIYTSLDFIPGATAVRHTGYFSDDYSEVAGRVQDANLGPPPYPTMPHRYYVGLPLVPPAIESLVRSTKYYWSVDETDAEGNTLAGDVWEFTIQGFKASSPNPPNEAIFVETDVLLSWAPGFEAGEHDVYLGTDLDSVELVEFDFTVPPPEFLGTTTEASLLVTGLILGVKYYWRVDEVSGRMPFPIGGGTYYRGDVWCFTTIPEGVGTIREDLWWGIAGDAVSDLLNDPRYPDNPDEIRMLTSFNSGIAFGDDYGGQIHGWLHPAKSGDYIFWLCSDDSSELFLSTDHTPANKVRIAYINGWAIWFDWYNQTGTDNPNQQSVPISLVGGQKYYIMARWKEDYAGDHCMVAWQGPDQPQAPIYGSGSAVIAGNRLSPFAQLLAHDPDPCDGQVSVESPVTLRWGPGDYADKHDVYVGTNKALVESRAPSVYKGRIDSNSYNLGPVFSGMIYYWAIDEVKDFGPVPGIWQGDVWSFTTVPAPIFVDVDATGANDGSNWADAYNSLQDGLARANSSVKPVEIRVAQGVYKPTRYVPPPLGAPPSPVARAATFQLIKGVVIKGAYAGFGEADPNAWDIDTYETILSGDLAGNDEPNFVNYEENSYHVVTGSGTDETAVLDGFTITAGYANGFGNPDDSGGGMYNTNGSPTVINCTFSKNAAGYAGGMANRDYCSPTLINCTFIGNAVTSSAAAIFNWKSSGTKLVNCTFKGNFGRHGGAVRIYDSSVTLTNCTFSGNFAREEGGALYVSFSSVKLSNCSFSSNIAGLFYGGGIYNRDGSSSLFLINCILFNNSDSGGMDESAQIHGGIPVVNYCCIQGWTGTWAGSANTGSDPMFERNPDDGGDGWGVGNRANFGALLSIGSNDDFGDLHLLVGSPCIDTGDPNYVPEPNETDLDSNPRIIGSAVDMGAYEFQNTRPVAETGADQVVECACNTTEETKVTLDGSGSYDADGDTLTYSWTGPFIESPAGGATPTVTLEDGCPGDYVITLVVNDGMEDSEPNEVKITVVDITPPEFTLAISPTVLWPPNKKMVKITPTWTLIDNCDATPEVSLVSISMNESDTRGNGNADDIQISDDGSIYVRAERNRSDDRIYTITYRAVDDYGNETEKSATVTVRRKKR